MKPEHRLPEIGRVVDCLLPDNSRTAAVWNGVRFVPLYNPDRVIAVVGWRHGAVCKAAADWGRRVAA